MVTAMDTVTDKATENVTAKIKVHHEGENAMNSNKSKKLLPFWNELNPQEQEQLLKSSISVKYHKGMLMSCYEQGCSGIMLILDGQLRTYIISEEGREVTLFRVYKNDVCVLSATGLMDAIENTGVIMIPNDMLSPLM